LNYLLIAFALLVAIAPLTHFLPSKRQRLQVTLRETAALNGLFVEFREQPGPALPQQSQASDVIYYGLRLPPSSGKGRRRCVWQLRAGGWQAVGAKHEPVPAALLAAPDSILAASVHEDSCGLYWQEAGDAATVEQIAAVLKDWAQQIP